MSVRVLSHTENLHATAPPIPHSVMFFEAGFPVFARSYFAHSFQHNNLITADLDSFQHLQTIRPTCSLFSPHTQHNDCFVRICFRVVLFNACFKAPRFPGILLFLAFLVHKNHTFCFLLALSRILNPPLSFVLLACHYPFIRIIYVVSQVVFFTFCTFLTTHRPLPLSPLKCKSH